MFGKMCIRNVKTVRRIPDENILRRRSSHHQIWPVASVEDLKLCFVHQIQQFDLVSEISVPNLQRTWVRIESEKGLQ